MSKEFFRNLFSRAVSASIDWGFSPWIKTHEQQEFSRLKRSS